MGNLTDLTRNRALWIAAALVVAAGAAWAVYARGEGGEIQRVQAGYARDMAARAAVDPVVRELQGLRQDQVELKAELAAVRGELEKVNAREEKREQRREFR